MHESIIFNCPPPARIAHTIALLLHDYCALYDPPSTPLLYAIHHTILVMPISSKGQQTGRPHTGTKSATLFQQVKNASTKRARPNRKRYRLGGGYGAGLCVGVRIGNRSVAFVACARLTTASSLHHLALFCSPTPSLTARYSRPVLFTAIHPIRPLPRSCIHSPSSTAQDCIHTPSSSHTPSDTYMLNRYSRIPGTQPQEYE